MGNMAKTRAAYRMAQNRKVEFTEPSNQFAEILDSWGYHYQYLREWPVVAVKGVEHGFHADFYFRMKPVRIVEVDGPYHLTAIQMRKSAWRDERLIEAGYIPIHVPVDMLLPVCKEVLEANVHQRIERGEPLSLREALKLV